MNEEILFDLQTDMFLKFGEKTQQAKKIMKINNFIITIILIYKLNMILENYDLE